jgi:hypothetical protein
VKAIIRRTAALAAAVAAVFMLVIPAQATGLPTRPPSVPLFTGLQLHDGDVMQGFARDPGGGWVFAQIQPGAANHLAGNLTFTHVSAAGVADGWMNWEHAGHGVSIGAQRIGGQLFIWTEANAVPDGSEGYGTAIARLRWQPGATLTDSSAGVEIFSVNAGAHHSTPSLDLADGLIAVRYVSDSLGVLRWAVYHLSDFTAHRYPAILRLSEPATLSSQTFQGWAVINDGTAFAALTGEAQTPDTVFWTVNTSGAVAQRADAVLPGLPFREPEGVFADQGGHGLCNGFASGTVPGQRLANVVCQF